MRTLETGEALDKIIRHVGHLPGETWAIDPDSGFAYAYADWTDVFDMKQAVYVHSLDWIKQGQNERLWVLLRLNQHPLIVFHPQLTSRRSVPQSALISISESEPHKARADGHSFDLDLMEWQCDCGNTMETDAETCGECGAINPFLGELI